MSEWERVIQENKNCWERKDNQVFNKLFEDTLLKYHEARETLTRNVLEQLGYDVKEVLETKGACIKHDITWEVMEHSKDEYLVVNSVRVGEIKFVNGVLGDRLEVKVYEQ